jgi:hypothetical protein
MTMKIRKGWYIIWADGTTWLGDCPLWASKPLPEGARKMSIRIKGPARWGCGHQH